jgi:hypothetical protein
MKKSKVSLILPIMVVLIICVVVPSAAATDPHITVDKSVSPTDIYLKGDGGMPDTANVVLSIAGAGDPIPGKETYVPADIVFVIDDTGSMSKIDQVKTEVNTLTDTLSAEIPDARFGLVTYKDEPETDLELTSDVSAFKDHINALYADGGGDWEEDVEDALVMAYGSSWRSDNVAKVVVLIGDAPPHDTSAAVSAASAAYVNEYGTYTNTIACAVDGTTDVVFSQIASAGHGTYTTSTNPTEDLVDAIISSIKTVVPSIDTAGEDVTVNEVVPAYIEADNFNPAPTTSSGNVYTWDLGKLGIGETKSITFDAKCTEAGDHKLVDVYPDTSLTYKAWDGSNFNTLTTIPFPETYINCKVSKDTTPPAITTSGKPKVLWPPNGKYQTVSLSDFGISVTDAGDPTVDASKVVITSVSSDELEDASGVGDGNTLKDIVIKDSQTVSLRAERDGNGNGRVYTINYKVTDASGNTAIGSSQVWVPHDKDTGSTAVDDGAAAGYTVSYP